MDEITSTSNKRIVELIKLHKNKYLEESDFFLVEGTKSLEELIKCEIKIIEIFITSSSKNKFKNLDKYNLTLVSEHVLKKLSTTDSVPEVVVLVQKKNYQISDFTSKNSLILLENIKDAGNLGTIIRSASAFECGGIILMGETVETYNPKVIRSSAGNFFKTPVLKIKDTIELKKIFSEYKLIATSLSNENSIEINRINKCGKNIVLFGSEASGLSYELASNADFNVKIPHSKNVESLNISTAASILLYEMYKNN